MGLDAFGMYAPNLTHPELLASGNAGDGSPEGVIIGSPGDPYWDQENSVMFVKDTGVGTSTGWVILSTAAEALAGAGSPEGSVAAPVGVTYWDQTGFTLYVKDTGIGNTGWRQSFSTSRLATYAAGTAATIGNSAAVLDFGTTDPSVTFLVSGLYELNGKASLKYNAASFSASQTVTLTFRRTNNTPADLTNGSMIVTLNIVTTLTGGIGVISLPTIYYEATAGDIVQIFSTLSALPSLGAVVADSAEITAIRMQ